MNYPYEDYKVIITGGTKGIGKAIAQGFLAQKAYTVITYSSDETAAEKFKQENEQYIEQFELVKFNVSKFDDCQKFFENYSSRHDRLDVLINNSGIKKDQIVMSMEHSNWNKVLEVNLSGVFNMSKLALFEMMKNRFGRIINISSISSFMNMVGQANYSASKAAVNSFSSTLAKEVAKKGITVNSICPGFIQTEMLNDLPMEQLKEYKKQVPMKRFGGPEEVADLCLFLSSKNAGYITGSDIKISGGLC